MGIFPVSLDKVIQSHSSWPLTEEESTLNSFPTIGIMGTWASHSHGKHLTKLFIDFVKWLLGIYYVPVIP